MTTRRAVGDDVDAGVDCAGGGFETGDVAGDVDRPFAIELASTGSSLPGSAPGGGLSSKSCVNISDKPASLNVASMCADFSTILNDLLMSP